MYRLFAEDLSIAAIAESGQCFRMLSSPDGAMRLIAGDRTVRVFENGGGESFWTCTAEEFEGFWRDYLDLDLDYSFVREMVLPEDHYLRRALEMGAGIRILRQDPWETLVSFIISQRKSVPAIRTSVDRLCRRFGREIEEGVYAFPSPESLASADHEALSGCGLGYRTPYVRDAARSVAEGRIDLKSLGELGTEELTKELMHLNGVGIKVASCAALYAYHRIDTVPVDVWMKRVIDSVYGGSLPEAYAPAAGLLQQYMFNYARIMKTGV